MNKITDIPCEGVGRGEMNDRRGTVKTAAESGKMAKDYRVVKFVLRKFTNKRKGGGLT